MTVNVVRSSIPGVEKVSYSVLPFFLFFLSTCSVEVVGTIDFDCYTSRSFPVRQFLASFTQNAELEKTAIAEITIKHLFITSSNFQTRLVVDDTEIYLSPYGYRCSTVAT